jgi:hypothetical protein
MNVRKNLRGERLEEVSEKNLNPGNPGVMVGIVCHLGSLAGGQISRGNDNHLCRRSVSAIKEAEHTCATDHQQDMGVA